jgi:parvulin-like peptidyl-prolyl isomerase
MDRVVSKIGTPSDKEVEDFYNNNKQRYVSARGVGLAAIVVDPADNGASDDAKNDTEAKNKIDIIYQRLKSGADFASVAREKSEDSQSSLRGGDLGFIPEDQLKQGGFPPDLIAKFFNSMQSGDITQPVKTPDGRWTVFKLTGKRLQNENLTFDNSEVKKDATDNIINQRKQILNAALVEVAMNDAKVVNNLASKMLDSPSNLSGLRPAQSPGSAATPAASPAGSTNAPAASASPAATKATTPAAPLAQPSPKKP